MLLKTNKQTNKQTNKLKKINLRISKVNIVSWLFMGKFVLFNNMGKQITTLFFGKKFWRLIDT